MTLDEAIKHCEEKAAELKKEVETWVHCPNDPNKEKILKDFEDCKKCAEEHRQLAEWLKELKELRARKEWIPVSDKLPKPFTYVNATCRSLVDDREDWVVETVYLPIPKEFNKNGFSDWGNIPMLNWGDAEVIAWTERIIPEPYKAESEGEG